MRGLVRFAAVSSFAFLSACSTPHSAPSAEAKAALAPTGKLKLGFLAAQLYAVKDPGGQYVGVAPDLGKDLARSLGVAYEPVPYTSLGALLAGAKSGEWDVATTGINAERAALLDFSAPFMEVEQGILVRSGVAVASVDDIDRAGLRIGVLEKSGADTVLTPRLKNAQLVRVSSVGELFALIRDGKVDAVGATRGRLLEEVPKLPGARVIDGRITVEPIGLAVPKGRSAAGVTYVNQFVTDVKMSGFVKQSIERAGLKGVTVAPLR